MTQRLHDALVALTLLCAVTALGWVLGGWMLFADPLCVAAGRM